MLDQRTGFLCAAKLEQRLRPRILRDEQRLDRDARGECDGTRGS